MTVPIESIRSGGSIISQSLDKDKVDLLEKTLDDILLKTQAKGVSASVGIPGEGIWCAARGSTGNTQKKTLTPDLKLYTGSIGKIFTAVVILKLTEEGRLSLDTPIAEWLPETSHAELITVNHLLTHTSEIAGFDDANEFESRKDLYRNPEQLLAYLNRKKLLFEPGKHYAYSNIGYIMLGIIIERATRTSYKKAIEHYIINKINLTRTDAATPGKESWRLSGRLSARSSVIQVASKGFGHPFSTILRATFSFVL